MTESLLQTQSQLISTVRTLIRETTAEEKELLATVKSATASAEHAKTTGLEESRESFEQKRTEAEQRKTKTLARVDERRELEPELLTDKHELRIIEINASAEDITEQTEAKLNEAMWLAESVYEGAMVKPRKQAQTAIDLLEETNEELNAITEEAPKVLSRLRQTTQSAALSNADEANKSMSAYVAIASKALEAIQSDPKATWFVGFRPAGIVFLFTAAGVAGAGAYTNWTVSIPLFAIPLSTLILSTLLLMYTFASGKNSIRHKHTEFTLNVNLAKLAYDKSIEAVDAQRRAKELAITTNRDVEVKKAEDKYKPRLKEVDRLIQKDLDKEKVRFASVAEKCKIKLEQDTSETNSIFENTIAQLELDEQNETAAINKTYSTALQSTSDLRTTTMQKLSNRWNSTLTMLNNEASTQNTSNQLDHPSWGSDWSSWEPNTVNASTIPLGSFELELAAIACDLPTSDELKLCIEPVLSIPMCASLPSDTSLLVSSSGKERKTCISLLQNAMLRVLTTIPPGKAKFTLIDPVGLGQTFASVLHLADYEESQLLDRAWTEPRHIETQLARLTEHMETVIQKYLRNEFESIDAYNEQAGEIAEPYRFLVIADFPNNFSEISCKRLASIVTSGARCGVHVIIHRDNSLPLPAGIDDDTLNRIPIRIIEDGATFSIDDEELRTLPLTLEAPPEENVATSIVKQVGQSADNTHRVEVPFAVIAPQPEEIWSHSTKDKVTIPLGRSGATKLQHLTLGRGTAQHALVAGKTGSGKSTLLHVLITNLALWYSPDEIEFYLVDFKKGVEFKTYAVHKLPHARVVAVESDREFGISVLQKIDEELKRRGELFRDLGVQDIAGFREKSSDPMPRQLLIIDEFQEFFVDDDKVAQEANLLLDRLVRQGRAFGIHAIMGSQTLDGAYTLSRSTMGQMAVRVALQCSEQDSYIILNEDNAAARLLSRPGEAIYNDAAGNVEGNSPFQVVWLNDKEREVFLEDLIQRDKGNDREMVVYEGNQPVYLSENSAFTSVIQEEKPLVVSAWLGGAMAITGDTSATFRHTSGSNLLIVGQQDETTTNLINSSLLSLDSQYSTGGAKFLVLDGTPKDASHSGVIAHTTAGMTNEVQSIGVRDVEQAMALLNEELQKRMQEESSTSPSIFFVVNALHRFRDLRRDEDDYGYSVGGEDKPKTASQILAELLKEGPPLGIHVITSTDTLANLNRTFDRQSLREFDMRVLLQMGANDSTNLIDMPDAARLGMHRALLYSEETGTIEPFRPYASPGS